MRPIRPVVAAAVLLAGCGGGVGGGGGEVRARWARAGDAEPWSKACALPARRSGCPPELRADYAGCVVRLLKPGSYQSGSQVTDNITRFAVTARAGRDRSITYYEVERRGGRDIVDIKVMTILR